MFAPQKFLLYKLALLNESTERSSLDSKCASELFFLSNLCGSTQTLQDCSVGLFSFVNF